MASSVFEEPFDVSKAVASALLVVGLGLGGWGTYLHLSLSGRIQAGVCDGCAPWHPLFVVAPLVAGTTLLTAAGYLFVQEYVD